MALGKEVADRIIEAGALAPSGDNLQPWLVERIGDAIRISVDGSRDRSLYNFRYQASLIAIGAMAENMTIAGRELGFDSVAEVTGGDGELPSISLTS